MDLHSLLFTNELRSYLSIFLVSSDIFFMYCLRMISFFLFIVGFSSQVFSNDIHKIEVVESRDEIHDNSWINDWDSLKNKKLNLETMLKIEKPTKTVLVKMYFSHSVVGKYLYLSSSRVISTAETFVKSGSQITKIGEGEELKKFHVSGQIESQVGTEVVLAFRFMEKTTSDTQRADIDDAFAKAGIF